MNKGEIHVSIILSLNFNIQKHILLNDKTVKYGIITDNLTLSIVFDNYDRKFTFKDIWNLKKCMGRESEWFIEWDTVRDNVLIFFNPLIK